MGASSRPFSLQESTGLFDIAVIGGGINGCGIAREAAGRSLSVLLVEKDDLASGTSSASTKLIHGGLRYLEHYEFRLVRESLMEREVLWAMAPHIIRPLRFVLPHHKGLRPAWLIRLGLFLYDHLGGRKLLPGCRTLNLKTDPVGRPLKPHFAKAFEYSDCWVDDARLVALNALDAAERGAEVRVRTEVTSARRENGHWRIALQDKTSGREQEVMARVIVNAAGPWVAEVLSNRVRSNREARIRLVRGSHIVVPKIFDHDEAYIFQNADQRIIFAIPYENDFTLIGTTDVDVGEDPTAAQISAEEISYLCGAVSEYFAKPVLPEDVVWTYSGIRPLYDDGAESAQKATRDYVLELDHREGQAGLLNVFGGKITTFRKLAEEALEKLAPALPDLRDFPGRSAALPGGDFAVDGFEAQVQALQALCPALEPATAWRLARSYGTKAQEMLAGVTDTDGLGQHFGAGLTECEVTYLRQTEWARTAEDILWRRSKLGLRLSAEERQGLADWIAQNPLAEVAAAADHD